MISTMSPDHTPDLSDNPVMDRVPSVSVVIPAWNRRETLRMSVESVLRQTYEDFELIVVDDGSTDGTMAAIADITDPRLRRLSHERNKGVSAARNTGIRAARADWVAFNDSDDEWLPLKLEKQMARLAEAGPEVVGCFTGLVHIEEKNSRTTLRYSPDPRAEVNDHNLRKLMLSFVHAIILPPTVIVSRNALLDVSGFDEQIEAIEDWECFFRIMQIGRFVFLDEPLVMRNFSENSLSINLSKMLSGRDKAMRRHHNKFLAEAPEALVAHYMTYAGLKRRQGDLAGARDTLIAASRLQPLSLRVRLRQARLLGDRLKKRLLSQKA